MVKIIKHYKQDIPSVRFVGLKYGEKDRVNGGFGHLWGEWFREGRFKTLEALVTEDFHTSYEDAYAYLGLMRWKEEGEVFEYWIGMFLPEQTEVPEGFSYKDFPASTVGICWLLGKEEELFMNEEQCANKLAEEGYELIAHKTGEWWFFERYDDKRFTQKDENGQVILDIGHYIQ